MKISRILFVCMAFALFSCQPKTDRDKLKSEEVKPDGSVLTRTFKPNGKLFAEILKKDGKKNGLTKNFYENGKVQVETYYVNDKKEGESKFYYLDGKICQLTVYKDDVKDGIAKHYYKNGKLACEIPYSHGEVEPGLKEYTSEGTPVVNDATIVVTPSNKLLSENKYILILTLSDGSHAVSFARVYPNGKTKKLPIPTEHGVGNLILEFNPAKGLKEDVILEGTRETAYGNPYVTRRTYKLSVAKLF